MTALKKINKIIFLILFLISCDETIIPTISNDISAYPEQEMYLYGSYTDKYQIRLSWHDYYGCELYNISIPEINYNETTEIQTYHDISDLNSAPGYYFTAYVSCSEEQGIEYSDSVIINTKEIDPIEDIIIHVKEGGYSDSLTFTHSSDTSIYVWYFFNFRFDKSDSDGHPISFNITESDSGWEQDAFPFGWWGETWPGWGTNKLDYYKTRTSENLDYSHCYVIRIVDTKNNYRDSHIKCNNGKERYESLAENPVEINSATNNLLGRIIITWDEYTGPDFYQYILWRSEYEDMSNSIKRASVIQSTQLEFHDRNDMPNGKKWYYQIETQNQYGRSRFSQIKLGSSRP